MRTKQIVVITLFTVTLVGFVITGLKVAEDTSRYFGITTHLVINNGLACQVTCKDTAVAAYRTLPDNTIQGAINITHLGDDTATHCLCLAR